MFYNADSFPWTKSLTNNWQLIKQEYVAIQDQVIMWPEAIHNGLWSVFGIVFQERDLNVKHLVPFTSTICDDIPGIHTYGFSVMKPGCEIFPHEGYTDEVLRCHLGLITNSKSGIEVGGEIRRWENGKAMIFDDTETHSAWNRGRSDRVILLIDFKR